MGVVDPVRFGLGPLDHRVRSAWGSAASQMSLSRWMIAVCNVRVQLGQAMQRRGDHQPAPREAARRDVLTTTL
jgi:hypothetical protein